MTTKKKIVYCLPALYIAGGMERVLTLKANYLAEAGYEIYIILTDGKDKPICFELSPKIKIIHLDIDFDELWDMPLYQKIFIYLQKQFIYKQRLKKQLMTLRPDITISMMRREINFINKIKDGSKKIGEIHTNRNNYRNFNEEKVSFFKKMLQKYWQQQLLEKIKRLDSFVVLSSEDRQQYPELPNVKVIPNPLAFYPQYTSDLNSRQVLAVGRYSSEKGFDLLLKTWQKVWQKHSDYILNIYGQGNANPYKELAKQLRLEKACNLNGPTDNIIEKYQESSIFVLSSRFEGFGMVITEAMSCGVPPVSFACPCGPKDIIKNGEDGLLVENGNLEQLAEKICYLIEHEDERKRMGQAARRNVERFKLENIGRQWEQLFEEVLKS